MKNKLILLMSLLSLQSCGSSATSPYAEDTITARDGSAIKITFFKHASLAIEHNGKHIYIDPVSGYADYASLPKADLVLITHSHYDHLDPQAIKAVSGSQCEIICDKTSADTLGGNIRTAAPGMTMQVLDGIGIETLPAYNTTEGHLQFHPREREDVGYLLTIGGTRIYIAGDSENTPEMKALADIDIAFLPVNQPYTMTVDQAVDAVQAMRPAIFYPYHYGEVEQTTDIEALAAQLKSITDVRIRQME